MLNDSQIQVVRKADISWFMVALAFVVLSSVSATASQVRNVTMSSGSGSSSADGTEVRLTIGESVTGTSKLYAGRLGQEVGLWYVLSRTYIVSNVGDIPVAQNQLMRSYPNPFNPSTTINFFLAQAADVRIDVYDLKGMRVARLFQGRQEAGQHALAFAPKNLASGSYFVSMRAGDFRATQRIMLVK